MLHEHLSRDYLSLCDQRHHFVGGGKKLYMMEQEEAFSRGRTCSQVLEAHESQAEIHGQAAHDLDGSPIHRSKVVKEFLKRRAAFRRKLEQLALLYAPQLNPDEGIRKHLKYVELKNVCCQNRS